MYTMESSSSSLKKGSSSSLLSNFSVNANNCFNVQIANSGDGASSCSHVPISTTEPSNVSFIGHTPQDVDCQSAGNKSHSISDFLGRVMSFPTCQTQMFAPYYSSYAEKTNQKVYE